MPVYIATTGPKVDQPSTLLYDCDFIYREMQKLWTLKIAWNIAIRVPTTKIYCVEFQVNSEPSAYQILYSKEMSWIWWYSYYIGAVLNWIAKHQSGHLHTDLFNHNK